MCVLFLAQENASLQTLKGQVLNLSLQMFGCRVVQKAIDVAHPETQQLVLAELHGHVLQCVQVCVSS